MSAYAGVTRRKDQWDDCSDSVKAPASGLMTTKKLKKRSLFNAYSTVCPKNEHPPRRLPCYCLYLMRLDAYLRDHTLSSWHRDVTLPLSNFRLNQPETASRGGQGIVFYVHDRENPSRKFALKFKDRQERSGSMWTLEKREMAILTQVQHPFIVRLLHSYETHRGLFMAMEYLSGGTLWKVVYQHGVLRESNGVYLSATMVDALHYLHDQDLIFRDLKAENVALDHEGRPRLIDFGLAKVVGSRGDNNPMTRYDFVSYLAPEIYRNPDKCDFKVDSWGIGYFLTELLLGYGITKAIPWEEVGKNHLAEDWCFQLSVDDASLLSESCCDFLQAMLARDPETRPSMAEAKKMPFFADVWWDALSTAPPLPCVFPNETPPADPPKPDLSPEKQPQGDQNTAPESEEEEEEEKEEYCAAANAPTIGSDSNFQYPRLKHQFQLPLTENTKLVPQFRPKVKKVVFLTVGNL